MCCGNDDGLVATFIYISMGAFLAVAVSLVVREGALAWSRPATGAVTMMTRHSRALRPPTSGFHVEYIMGERSSSRGVARCSRGRSCLVALRDGRCDSDDAAFDSFPLLYIEECVTVIGEAEVAACRLSFERAQLLRRAMRGYTVTMMMVAYRSRVL